MGYIQNSELTIAEQHQFSGTYIWFEESFSRQMRGVFIMPCGKICARTDDNISDRQGAESLPSCSERRPCLSWPQRPAIRDRKAHLPLHGFTLIELLVVIAVIALLIAILIPSLQRVKNQARAVKCQANLHQWGLIFSAYTTENDGRFWPLDSNHLWYNVLEAWCYEDLCFCPMAVKVNSDPERHRYPSDVIFGSKFTAWDMTSDILYTFGKPARGSYGANWWIHEPEYSIYPSRFWRTCLVERPASVPVLMDCCWSLIIPEAITLDLESPPEYDDVIHSQMSYGCINRHNGGINVLFMDWSARKVGLKELWTLKWHREFNTKNKWTRAGGVHPGAWPEWMRKFKDY
jgi:prepilin-type N-terminal cleavage/methylation domain-containing protein/prepilin-type processing-associated H-X9-DG protein